MDKSQSNWLQSIQSGLIGGIVAILVALVLGVLGGIYPAWRASRFQPVEALRYE